MYADEGVLKYSKVATALSRDTAIWVSAYAKEYLYGDLTKDDFKKIIVATLIEHDFSQKIKKTIERKMNYDNILNIEDIVVDNIIKTIDESKEIALYTSKKLIEEYEIKYLFNAFALMFAELLYGLEEIIKGIESGREKRAF